MATICRVDANELSGTLSVFTNTVRSRKGTKFEVGPKRLWRYSSAWRGQLGHVVRLLLDRGSRFKHAFRSQGGRQ